MQKVEVRNDKINETVKYATKTYTAPILLEYIEVSKKKLERKQISASVVIKRRELCFVEIYRLDTF